MSDRSWAAVLGTLAVVAALLAVPDLRRTGYSPDEEFTLVAVRGIEAHGLPVLPSGLLYDRGLAYSFAAWLAGLAGGQSLPVFRALSLACAALSLWILGRELRRLTSPAAAALAVCLAASSLPFWVSATTARFYAPFLLCYLVAIALVGRPQLTTRGAIALACAAAAARWTHELAFTLAAVPCVAVLLVGSAARGTWIRRALWIVAGLVAGQVAIFAVHALGPPSNGDVMVRRFFLWQVLNLFERPPLDLVRTLPAAAAAGAILSLGLALARWRTGAVSAMVVLVAGTAAALGQLGVGLVVALAGLPVAGPTTRRAVVTTALGVAAGATVFWTVALVTAGLDAPSAVARVTTEGLRYPLDMSAYVAGASPLLVIAVLAGLLARAAGAGGPWPAAERALHGLWIGWMLWFGVIESGITQRYLLLPVTFMLAALAVDLAALAAAASRAWRPAAYAAGVAVAALVSFESWRGPAGDERRWVDARPTIDAKDVSRELLDTDLVACTDELACLLVAARVDAWLVLDAFFRERFVVMRRGVPTGAYTGAPASPALTPLLERTEREHRRLVVLEVLKDVPGFGSTAALVTRQLARERLRGEVIGEVPRVRLVHIVRAPEALAARAR